LGEELNPNPDHGLLELVKNSYDADARNCTIELTNTHEPGGCVEIVDDGTGMDRRTIEDEWLVLGRSLKSIRQPTPRFDRLPAGSKGLGRLAALRLGTRATLLTRPENEPNTEYELDIDWRAFDQAEVVEKVRLDIQWRRRPSRVGSGTVIRLLNLRTRITRTDVKRLARGILLLADPFENPTGFHPKLLATEFEDLEQLVQRRYFDDAEFRLVAEVDAQGRSRAAVTDWRGNTLYAADHAELCPRSPGKQYSCPPARFDLWAYILDTKTFSSRPTTVGEVREWLGEFGGVHLYIRGLRVAPYGNPGNDWLEMNLSRVRSPELRPGTNTSIGRIATDDPDEQFIQKTDRTGLIESDAFQELKRFATDALNWMAKRRLEERDQRRTTERAAAPRAVTVAKQVVDEAIEKLSDRTQPQVQAAFEKYDAAREREATALRKEIQLYRTLSTAGITAAVFAHESRHPQKLIKQNALQVQRLGKELLGKKYADTLSGPVERILRQADTLQAFGDLTLSQIDHEKRRVGRVEVHDVVQKVFDAFGRFLDKRKVEPALEFDAGNPYLRASEAAIESIVTNLLANSLKAFDEAGTAKRLIVARTEITNGQLTLRMLDSGPGIEGLSTNEIWLPGETTYPNGTGLGLTIVRDTVRDLGGEVDAVKHGELGGAEIILRIPILGA
jgi:signal transduction histidine kinase